MRKIGNTLIHGCEAVGEEYFRFLDKAHYAISDARREAGYNGTMAVYDAAHEIAFDRPEAYANVVGDFIERQEAFVVNADPGLIAP